MTREFTITRRTYTGSIDFLRGAEVTMAEPGGDRYARVTVRSGGETYYLENVGHDSITTQTLHRTVRWTSDYAHRARDAAQQIDSADPHRATRLARYASLCARAARTLSDNSPGTGMALDAGEAAAWAADAEAAAGTPCGS